MFSYGLAEVNKQPIMGIVDYNGDVIVLADYQKIEMTIWETIIR